jgi:hypothetical protein
VLLILRRATACERYPSFFSLFFLPTKTKDHKQTKDAYNERHVVTEALSKQNFVKKTGEFETGFSNSQMDVLDGFLEWSLSVQHSVHRSLTPGDAVVPWRDLVDRERRALEQLPRNAEDIPTHIIPAAYPGLRLFFFCSFFTVP